MSSLRPILRMPKSLFRLRQGRAVFIAALVALGLAFMAHPAYAAIRYVDPDATSDGQCLTPNTACDTITEAHTAANPGDDIYVAAGVYTEPQISVSKRVTVTGGFNPDGPTLWNSTNYTFTPTILDGENARRLFYITGDDVTLQYLTIRNGNATTSAQANHYGGGILVASAENVLLRGLTVISNVASDSQPFAIGGGVAQAGTSTLTIERSLILSNTSPGMGGGIGLAVAAANDARITIRSTVIAHNAAVEGGAIATNGDGNSNVQLFFATIADNNKGLAEEAIFMNNGENLGGTPNYFASTSSLLLGNTTAFFANTDLPVTFGSLGFIMDKITNDYTGNHIAANPAIQRDLSFVNPLAGNYRLVAGSPAIDVGATSRTDLDGRTWTSVSNCTPFTQCPLGKGSDFGAHEYLHPAPVVRYVALEGIDTINNCLNPALPCETLEQANEIALGGDEIRLAHGIYTDGDANCANSAVICISEGITLTGGFTLTNWLTPAGNPLLTILDGNDTRRGIDVDYNAPTGSSLIRNLTVRNGASFGNGGGIAINTKNIGPAHNLTIRNCRVENNQAGIDGGGIFANEPVNLRVENCTINDNYVADGRGGGLAVADANGVSTYTLTSLIVHNNWAIRPDDASPNGGMGGGVFLQGVGTLRQSEVYSNVAAFSGGGITTGSNGAHPTIDRVYIHDNRAGVGGGFSIFLTGGANLQNSLLVRNVATSTVGLVTGQTSEPMLGGNAIHSPYIGVPNEPLRVINVTIADNVGATDEAIMIEGLADGANSRRNFFTNVLISGNAVGIRSDGDGFAELVKVLMTNDVTTPTDNFNPARLTGTPLSGERGFVSANDYHLVPGADGVDDGDTVPGITQDLDGVGRPVGAAFDIGAYETTLEKQNQTITFAPISNQALADSPVPIAPTSSSGLPVQVTSTTPAICTVAANNVTLIAVGICTLEANQPGNATFNPAPTVTRSFEIGIDVPQETMHLPVVTRQ